ncbi:MAG: zf-HC2 domain-containing protein [Gemmatimonadota bacterium]
MMNCREVAERLEDYADGLLEDASRVAIEAHLDACESCRRSADAMLDLRTVTAALPRNIQPSRDLWPGIESALSVGPAAARSPSRFHRRQMVWLAVAAMLLIALSSSVTALLLRRSGAKAGFRTVQAEYVAASADLARRIGSGPQSLSPRTLAIVQRNLRIIDAAIQEAEAALVRDPGNVGLERILWARYQQRIDLLERATRSQETS